MDRLAGKVAIVTGGGTGIGAATARLFAQEGVNVLVVGRREEPLIDVVKEINARRASSPSPTSPGSTTPSGTSPTP